MMDRCYATAEEALHRYDGTYLMMMHRELTKR